jgi:hypothetical protein
MMIRMKPKYFDSMEISSAVAEKARSFCVTNSYDPSLYSKDPNGVVALNDDLARRNIDAYTFPGSSQLTVDEPYKTEFERYDRTIRISQGSEGPARYRAPEADSNGYRRASGLPSTP